MRKEKNQKSQSNLENEWLSVSEVSDLLKCHEQTIRSLIHCGKLPAIKIGWSYRIRMSDLPESLAVRKTPSPRKED